MTDERLTVCLGSECHTCRVYHEPHIGPPHGEGSCLVPGPGSGPPAGQPDFHLLGGPLPRPSVLATGSPPFPPSSLSGLWLCFHCVMNLGVWVVSVPGMRHCLLPVGVRSFMCTSSANRLRISKIFNNLCEVCYTFLRFYLSVLHEDHFLLPIKCVVSPSLFQRLKWYQICPLSPWRRLPRECQWRSPPGQRRSRWEASVKVCLFINWSFIVRSLFNIIFFELIVFILTHIWAVPTYNQINNNIIEYSNTSLL